MIKQKLLELLLDVTNIFIGIYDVHQQCFIKINKYGLQMFEADTLEGVSKSLRKELLPKEKVHQMLEVLKLQKEWEEETVFLTKTGEEFWGRSQINFLEHEGNIYLLVRITNINQFKLAEREAQSSEERFKALFENAAVGIIVSNDAGEIVIANHFMQSLFGYKVDELIGQQVELLLPDSLRAVHVKHREGYAKHHKIRPMGEGMELQAQRKDGSTFPVEVSLSYFFDKGKMFAVAFIQDISFKVQAAQQLHNQKAAIEKLNASLETEVVSRTQALLETLQHLEKSKEDLEKALAKEKELGELKSRFVSMASHEFRTPLSAILSSSTLIGKYQHLEEQPKREKHIGRIQSSVGFLTDILEEFLSVGKLEEDQVKAKYDHFDWNRLMNEIIADMKSILKKGQKIDFSHQGDATIFLDQSLLRKVLINLISNAIKFSPENATILVSSTSNHNYFAISVKDEGIGISESDLKHLFERFFRGANAVNIQGTGLGLHIVAKYVELMHGKIGVDSKLGEGTTIQLTFPPYESSPLMEVEDTSINHKSDLNH